MRLKMWMGMALVAGILLSGSRARADADLSLPAGTLVASLTTSGAIADAFAATVKSWVFDPGALGGADLIFAWQITMTSGPDPVDRVTAGLSGQWSPFSLVTHHTPGAEAGLTGSAAGTQAPSGHGVTLGGFPFFDFDSSGSGTLDNGETSYILWVATNSPSYATGKINLINAGTLTLDSFAPIPEPASLLLLGTGLLGFAGMVRKKLGGKKNANQ